MGAVKRNLREAGYAKVKVGHGGTLDPLASGVLPIALGEATKLAGRMLDATKEYEFTIAFGLETDTLDRQGRVVAENAYRPTLAAIEALLPRFVGSIRQVPPVYSAIKVAGERAYDRARAGETVALMAREVTVFALSPIPFSGGAAGAGVPCRSLLHNAQPKPAPSDDGERLVQEITLLAHVSKGTYIRSLARDIARGLGTCGHVAYLRRTSAGPFGLDRAISLDKLNEIGKGARLENVILPLEAGLDDIPALDLGPEEARAVRQGRVLNGLPQDDGLYWARQGRTPVALVELSAGNARIVRGFNLTDVAE